MTVHEGDWVRVEVPDASFPMFISIDGREPRRAFIDRVRSEEGAIVTVAAIRCPALRRGQHSATAHTNHNSYTATFEVD